MVSVTEGRTDGPQRIEIPNDLQTGTQVLETIVVELRRAGFEAKKIGQIELAFTEALINAIRHGNQDDPDKLIQIEYEFEADQFWLAIEDEGHGFCPNTVDDPRSEENVVRPGGRGLLLIRSLVETVEFSARGNRIRMSISRKGRHAA